MQGKVTLKPPPGINPNTHPDTYSVPKTPTEKSPYMAAEKILIKWPIHSTKQPLNPQKTAEKRTMNNLPHHTPKATPPKQGEDNLKLLPGTNFHPKVDGSTTPSEKNLSSPPKQHKNDHE